jgi:hypothetical protein
MVCQACGVALAPQDDWPVDIQRYRPGDRDANGSPAGAGEFRRAVCCFHCAEEVREDMWTTKRAWDALPPCVPFDALPLIYGGES